MLYDSTAAKPVVRLENKADGEEIFVQGYLPEDEPVAVADGDSEELQPYKYRFDIPDSGIWVMKEVSVFDVYGEDSTPYLMPEDGVVDTSAEYGKGLIFDADDGFVETEVAVLYERDVKISYNYDKSKLNINNELITFGKTGNEVTAEFMTSNVLPQAAIEATVYDDNNLIAGGYFNVQDLEIVYSYGKINYEGTKTYGGYTGGEYMAEQPLGTPLTFTKSGSGKFVNDHLPALDFKYASEYDAGYATCTVTAPGTDGEVLGGASLENARSYSIETYSKAPTVYISDITLDGTAAYSVDLFDKPDGSIYDDVKSSGGFLGFGATNKYTTHASHLFASKNTQYISKIESGNLTAWLYFKCSHQDIETYQDKNFVNRKPHQYLYAGGEGVPAATLTISGMGKATNAKLTFKEKYNGEVIMITEYTADRIGGTYWGDLSSKGTDSYEWTKDGAVKRYIGVMDNGAGENGSDSKTVAGTISANKLVLTFDGNDYTFTIPTITIHNKY